MAYVYEKMDESEEYVMFKKLLTLGLAVVMILALSTTAFAATGADYAYVYGFDYKDNAVDTTAISAQQQMYLSNLGYTTYCNTDVGADFAVGNSPKTNDSRMNSAVVVFNGHSGPGSYQMYGGGRSTYLTAKKSGGVYYKFGDIDMSNTKIAFFMGCNTASTERDSTYGTLTDDAVSCGADSAFGWEKSVPTSDATSFRERIFYFLRFGYTLSDAAANAASEMPWFSATKSYRISGKGSTVLTRATRTVQNDNVIDFNTALGLIETEDYRLLQENASGIQTYVKYVNGIATSEYIDVNSDEHWAIKAGDTFSDEDVNSFVMPIHEQNLERYKGSDTLTSRDVVFSKTGERILKVMMKVNSVPTLVAVISTTYESENGLSYMTEKYVDMNTGEELSYQDIQHT